MPEKVAQPSLVAGDGSLTVSWLPPSDGGSAITDYDVRYIESSYIGCADCGVLPWVDWQPTSVSTTPWTRITGLTNGTSYAVVVRAKNSVGAGPWSDDGWGTPVAAASVPRQLTLPTVVVGDGSLTVSWNPPADGGSAITGYDVWYRPTSSGSYTELHTTATSITISSLTNGTSYGVFVRAKNSVGPGAWSEGRWATPTSGASVPDKPASPAVVAGDGSLTVSWSAPADGGSVITGYEIRYRPSTSSGSYTQLRTAAASITISGLTNGTGYTVFVRAQNAEGSGEWSDATSGTPTSEESKPAKPSRPSVVAGDRSLTVSWSPPADGGSAITGYEVWYSPDTSSQSRTRTTSSTSLTLTGVTNGTSYRVHVRARNSVGVGEWSDAQWGTPVALVTAPGAPRDVVLVAHGESRLRASWSAPASTGGSAIDHYLVKYGRGSLRDDPIHGDMGPWSSRIYEVKGTVALSPELPAGVWHWVRVVAVNSAGRHSLTTTADSHTALPQAPAERPLELGQAEITHMEQLGAWNPRDKEDAVRIEWKKVSGATGYEVAYWFRRPYGETLPPLIPLDRYKITVKKLVERGKLICERSADEVSDGLPCGLTLIETVSGENTNEYETLKQFDDAKIPARLEVAVRAINSNTDTKGEWSEYYSLPERKCDNRTFDLDVLGKASMVARFTGSNSDLLKTIIQKIGVVGLSINIIDRMLNDCRSFQEAVADEIIDHIPFLRQLFEQLFKAFEETKCKNNIAVYVKQLPTEAHKGTHPESTPYIMCGVLYDIDSNTDQYFNTYKIN